MPARMSQPKPPAGGFTLVELVVVMLLMAIITGVAASRFASREPFAAQSGADQLVSALRVAQATAVAQRRAVFVTLAASPLAITVCLDAACTQPVSPPGGDSAWIQDSSDVKLDAGASFSFDASGAPSFASGLDLQLRSSDGSASARPIRIETISGHVRQL